MRLAKFFCLISAGFCALPALAAIEPWTDKDLPVQKNLELWLDASRENAAREGKIPLVASGGPLDIWHDASGYKRDVAQVLSSRRPHFFQVPGPAVRFDGGKTFLVASGLNQNLSGTTVFIRFRPRSNVGDFHALLAVNRAGLNDYSSGLNIDFGPDSLSQFNSVNIEGSGFTGIQNLLATSVPFNTLHTIAVTVNAGKNGVSLWFDGAAQNKRDCANSTLAWDDLTIGARHFSNIGEPPYTQGFFDGDISEALIYSRVLSDTERAAIERYLASKVIANIPPGRTLAPLVVMSNAPSVQMLVPGFTARELPVKLSNINCVKYRPDGKLVALGYDGNIWLLSDTDGDGLEDKATPFWNKPSLRAPIGMALTPPGYAKGEGVFIPSKGKLSLIVDTNHDDIADEEIVVAQGWPELPHGVDALGAAVDKDGNIYFGLGTASFGGAYLIDPATGKSHYDLKSERGTILKVSADFSHREIVCTGIRFPVAMAFNSVGDLFCTDQEGATWLPNGNPFDELLHIEPGRHYGFPPRHPKHLPDVIDEPSVFDYAPQHQSTCGLNFNERDDGKFFGPSWWRGDAIVTGYSRGKLWRTKLAKTAAGYVAQNQMIAILNMLAVDACVSSQGDLVVAVHSGQPDWGTGPKGAGKLYKISYTQKDAPQPALVWAASPTETRVEFDRPLDAAQLKNFAKQVSITQGRYAAAGDRFETVRPGYQAVQNQMVDPRYELELTSVALDRDGRIVVIRTVPRTLAVNYAVTLPSSSDAKIDLVHDLSGVETIWRDDSGAAKWTGWLPHFDLAVARAFTSASAEHARLWPQLSKPGQLTLRTQLDLRQMLRAATQPGAKLDFEYPDETVTVVLKSKQSLQVSASAAKIERISDYETHLVFAPKTNWFALETTLQTSTRAEPLLEIFWFTAEDNRPRAFPLRRFLLPWAEREEISRTNETERVVPEIAGGNWLRGRKIFFGDQAACFKCHLMRGDGGKVGPDLSNLIHRDFASVMKDITQPSAAINPDHVAYNIELKDGELLTGVSIGENENEFSLADAGGKAITISKKQITSMKPSTISLMPEGLLQNFSERQVKDLLTFLLAPPPLEPAPFEISGEPPPRERSEVNTLLKNLNVGGAQKFKPLRIVLCAGPKDHGPSEHDYPLWQKRWSKLLALADGVTVDTAFGWPKPEQFLAADEIVFYSNNPGWSVEHAAELDAFLKRGGGLVFIHYAVDGHEHVEELAQRIGLAWRGGGSRFRHGALDLKFQAHPLAAGLGDLHFVDESYWQLIGNKNAIQLLASDMEDGVSQPLMWTREQGKGRVFVSVPGHYTWTFDDPFFRLLLLRGIAWAAGEPIDRFSELSDIGARIRN